MKKSLIIGLFSAIQLCTCLTVDAQSGASIINPNFAPKVVEHKSREGFIHPGIILSANDLNRIQKMVRSGYEPWATAFEQFRKAPKASKEYRILNQTKEGKGKFPVMSEGYGQYDARRDADAAFAQTIMWYITGDADYARKVLQILRLWSSSIQQPSSDILTAGMAMQKFCFAAEVMRYAPRSGWTEDDTKNFIAFLKVMLPSNDKPTAFMNQGSIGTMGYMSSGIFMDDTIVYAKAIARTTVGRESEVPNRDYSIMNQLREVVDSVTGEKKIILVEMGRDQGHAQGDIGALGSLARTAFIQQTKVDEEGNIVNDNRGVNVFQFLNNRLLKAAGIVAKFNLGYDEIFYPRTPVGTKQRPEYFQKVSSALRGQLHPVYELIYNHYRYDEGVAENDSSLKLVKKVIDFYTPEEGSEDFPGDGTLLFTPEPAMTKMVAPKGPPKKLTLPDYATVTKNYGRIQAETFVGSKGNISTDLKRQNFGNGDVGYRPVTDHEGTRRIISEIKEKFYVWYKDVDFGAVPVDKMVIRTASSIGCKMDVVLLDDISGIDWSKVTEEDMARGEKVATIQVPATGWWTYFTIFTAQLNKKLAGKHSFAFRFYGSGHVYTLQATMDWFKLVRLYGNEDNNATAADVFINGAHKINNDYVQLNNGSGIIFNNMDFDSGIDILCADIASKSSGLIEIRNGNAKGRLLASYRIPNTADKFISIQRKSDIPVHQQGKADVCIVYKGQGALKLRTYKNKSSSLQFETTKASHIKIVRNGEATLGKEQANIKATREGTSVVFHTINFMNTPKRMAMKLRTNNPSTILLHNITAKDSLTHAPFLTIQVPNTKGRWETIYTDMKDATKTLKGEQMVIMTVKGDDAKLDFAEMQFDPIEITPLDFK